MTPLDSTLARRRFARAAQQYQRAAFVQREVESRLLQRLQWVVSRFGEPERVADLGCGTGGASLGLNKAFPAAQVIAGDFALPMLRQARSVRHRVVTDFHQLPLADSVLHGIVSNLALQWSPQPGDALAEWLRVLDHDGWLLFTTFGPATLHELRAAWQSAADQVVVHPHPDAQHLGDLLTTAGARDVVMDIDRIIVPYDDPMQLCRDLQTIGATNAQADRRRGLTGRSAWRRMREHYQRDTDGQYPATYEVIYGLARGRQLGTARITADGQIAAFPVDQITRLPKRS